MNRPHLTVVAAVMPLVWNSEVQVELTATGLNSDVGSELELRHEPLLLVRVRRVVAVVVQAALADGDDLRVLCQFAQGRDGLRVAVSRVVRMHAGGGVEPARCGKLGGAPAVLDGGAGEHDGLDARVPRARQHVVEVFPEGRMREVRPDVRQPHGVHSFFNR